MTDLQIRHFSIPAVGDRAAEEALNHFLRANQILDIRQEFVADPPNGIWYIAVRYAQSSREASGSKRSSIDYKDVLGPEAFARFVPMRERRKVIAQEENLPPFAVFTDKELAAIAELEDPTPEDLKKIKGIGAKRVERFGARILGWTAEQAADEGMDDEASGKSI
jgi:superfamily II DNA helicase RecQ